MRSRLFLSPQAEKDLKKLERLIHLRIGRALLLLSKNPYPTAAKTLQDKRLPQFRMRVGDYRILYDVYPEGNIIYILRIGHRKDIYK